MTTDMPAELESTMVVNLMTDNGKEWDEDVINDICNERDRELIKRIPIPSRSIQDSWFWLFEDTGCFTVKSCYRKLQGEQVCDHAAFWRKMWSLQLPSKITTFMWRVCRNCLPTAVNLASKRVQIDTKCSWCLVRNEDDTHVLFDCSFARTVWTTLGVQEMLHINHEQSAVEIIYQLFNICTKENLALVAMICWNLWYRQNKWVWDKVMVSDYGVQATARNMLSEWRQSQQERVTNSPVMNSSARRWSPPPQGWVKVNTDAAVFEGEG